MTAEVVALWACRKCGKPGRPLTLTAGVVEAYVAKVGICEPCLALALDGAARLRRLWDVLIAEGVDKDHANKVLILLIDLEREARG